MQYTVKYRAVHTCKTIVNEAYLQHIILPENNATQELISEIYTVPESCSLQKSINGFGFNSVKLHCKAPFKTIVFEAVFALKKIHEGVQKKESLINTSYQDLNSLEFRTDFETWLTPTDHTSLPEGCFSLFKILETASILEYCLALNSMISAYITLKSDMNPMPSKLGNVLSDAAGNARDLSHVLIAVARQNKLPARFVSGYLYENLKEQSGSQLHAWVEIYCPNSGWLGIDPSYNCLANQYYIKIAHGRDYTDCAPVKSIFYASGKHEVNCIVTVASQQ
ncbi:transglutaminase-like domain-containing protein [Formosa sp. A9]|uniref:transglutaminase-like domain-containing protein n=1 Tax=Formosa sp. A9 TaxID=3442641 RepID=UPI003EBF5794